MPVTKTSALSFGLIPYSSKGYNLNDPDVVGGQDLTYVYSGKGGVSKAYLGYGVKLGNRFSIGANASYLFGKLTESKAAEYNDFTSISSGTQSNR